MSDKTNTRDAHEDQTVTNPDINTDGNTAENLDNVDEATQELTPEQEAFKQQMLMIEKEILHSRELAEKAKTKSEEYAQAARSLQKDFDNYRRRNQDSIEKARTEGKEDVISAILPLMDVMEQAIAMITDSNVAMGVKMIQRQFTDTLSSFGVSEIESLGQDFDPELHNAIGRVKSTEYDSGKIVEVLNKGYRIGDKVLRHSNVRIAE